MLSALVAKFGRSTLRLCRVSLMSRELELLARASKSYDLTPPLSGSASQGRRSWKWAMLATR
jgi:hypothetical protein